MRVRRAADELELPVTMHVNETPAEIDASGERTIARLERLGLLSPLLAAVHMVHLDDMRTSSGWPAAASASSHCPQSNLKLGNGVCRVAGAARARRQRRARHRRRRQQQRPRHARRDAHRGLARPAACFRSAPPLTAHDWLRAATLNGARALGLAEVIGSLDAGQVGRPVLHRSAPAAYAAGVRPGRADRVRRVARPGQRCLGRRPRTRARRPAHSSWTLTTCCSAPQRWQRAHRREPDPMTSDDIAALQSRSGRDRALRCHRAALVGSAGRIPSAARAESGAAGLRRRRARRLRGKRVLDVGCGGGLLSEAMARRGAQVTGIDLAPLTIEVAELHALESGVPVSYLRESAETHAAAFRRRLRRRHLHGNARARARTARACCARCTTLVRPGGHVFVSTLNRNLKSYLLAVVGAEYVLNLLRARHAHVRAIHQAFGAGALGARRADSRVEDIAGLDYDPLQNAARQSTRRRRELHDAPATRDAESAAVTEPIARSRCASALLARAARSAC